MLPIPFQVSTTDLIVYLGSKLKFHQHVSNDVHKEGEVAHTILKSTINCDASLMLPFCFWNMLPQFRIQGSHLRQLVSVQIRWTKEVHGLKDPKCVLI